MADDVAGLTVRDHLASGQHHHPISDHSDELDVVARQDHRCTLIAQCPDLVAEQALRPVVEATRRLIEQHHQGLGSQHHTERKGQPLTLREILGMTQRIDRVAKLIEESGRRAWHEMVLTVSHPTLVTNLLGIEQETGILWDQPDQADPVCSGQVTRCLARHVDRAGRGCQQTSQRPEQRRLARTIAAHEGRHRPGREREAHPIDRPKVPIGQRESRH